MNSKRIKELNILNINGNKISIKLKTNYLVQLKESIKKDRIYNLEKALNVNYSVIWQAIKRNSFPLYILKELSKHFKLEDLRNNIEAYKFYRGKKWIKRPIFTIKESPEFVELAGHMLGDGFLTINKGGQSSYTNMSKVLINKFKNLCNKVFGSINLETYVDKRFDAETVRVPKQISMILSKFYPEILNKSVPKSMLTLPKEYLRAFIRAFADDESCVTTSAILYTQKSKEVLEDIRKLHLLVGFKEENLTQVKEKKDICNFSIIGNGLIYFYTNIGYKHPGKMRDLEVEVKRKENRRVIKIRDTTKKEITECLDSPKTIKELSAIIGIQPTIIRKHMKKLLKESYVKIISHQKYNVPVWIKIKDYQLIDDRRKHKIIQLLQTNKLSTLEISKNIGLGKDRLSIYLYELKKQGKINYKIKGRTYVWYLE